MTARVYRADDPRRTGERPIAREGVVLHPEPLRGDPELVAAVEAHLRAAMTPECRTTHHTGCACHEARRDARERELVAEVEYLRTESGYSSARERDRSARERDRVAALESALRASLARWRDARGRYTPFPHCDVCGVRLAADGTETHDAECAVGRDLRVLGGGAT